MTAPRAGRTRGGEGGFTLLEVMIALGILLAGMVVLLDSSGRNVRASNRARALGLATNLARAKMLDIEEELLHTGFQDTAETMEGDFSDEGFPRFTWSALVEKVQLPGAGALQTAVGEAGTQGDPGQSGAGQAAGVAGILGTADPTAAAGFSMIMSQFELIRGVLEQAIRRVTLTVTWKVGNREEKLTVVCYFTDPKAVDTALGGLPNPNAGGSPGSTSGTSGTTGSTGGIPGAKTRGK